MKKLNKKLRKWFYIETVSVKVLNDKYKADYIVWYPNFVTIPFFGRRYTFIIGLNFHLCSDITDANDFMDLQKLIYKTALIKKIRN